MNILILNGSPHPNGTTAQLRAAFEAAALCMIKNCEPAESGSHCIRKSE